MDTMPVSAPELSPPGTRSQHWLARLSFALAGLAIVLLLVFAGLKSLAMLAVAVAAAVVSLAAAYVFLSRRGVLRWLSLAVFVLAPIVVIVVYAFKGLLWIALLSAGIWLLASMTARAALAGRCDRHHGGQDLVRDRRDVAGADLAGSRRCAGRRGGGSGRFRRGDDGATRYAAHDQRAGEHRPGQPAA